jgi:hypothetical protein
MAMTAEQFVESRREEFQRNVTTAIKTLIEDKHLYQSVTVPRLMPTCRSSRTTHGSLKSCHPSRER